MGFGHTGVAYIFEEGGEYHAFVVAPAMKTYRHIKKAEYDQVYAAVKNSTHRHIVVEEESDRFWRHATFLNPELIHRGPSQQAYNEAPDNLRKLNIAKKNALRYRSKPDIAEAFEKHVAAHLLWFRLNGIELEATAGEYTPVVPFFEEEEEEPDTSEEYRALIVSPLETARLNQYGTISRKRWF